VLGPLGASFATGAIVAFNAYLLWHAHLVIPYALPIVTWLVALTGGSFLHATLSG
jgi:hypothetical protein